MSQNAPQSAWRHYVIYNSPSDFPGKYVVREWWISGHVSHVPGTVVTVCNSLAAARAVIPPFCDYRIQRSTEDDQVIVETWI